METGLLSKANFYNRLLASMTVQSKKLEGKTQHHQKTQCNVTQLKVGFFSLTRSERLLFHLPGRGASMTSSATLQEQKE